MNNQNYKVGQGGQSFFVPQENEPQIIDNSMKVVADISKGY